MTKFEWQASESAPKNYPMKILSGSLFYNDGSGSLYVPNKVKLHNGWGEGRSTHLVGPDLKPLPNRLSITFFSYTENQFYSGKFDLPYDTILKMFQEGYQNYIQNEHITYNQIVVGVAPGGAVAVWLVGITRATEVFFGQAEKVEGNWSSVLDNPNYTREEHVRFVLKGSLKTPEDPEGTKALETLRKNGVPFGLWERYRTRYLWQPVFLGMVLREGRSNTISYFNGESEDHMKFPLEPAVVARPHPVPKFMDIAWMRPGVPKGRLIELFFDETEILAAFKQLGLNNTPLRLELRADALAATGFTIWLRDEKDPTQDHNLHQIELKRTEVKNYGL